MTNMKTKTNSRIIIPEQEFTRELSLFWLQNMYNNNLQFLEPHLDLFTTEKIKLLCDHLGQDSSVFLTAVDILERYIDVQDRRQKRISDPFIFIMTAVYIAGKLCGDLGDLSLCTLTDLYSTIIRKPLENLNVKNTEIQILTEIDCKLPLITQLDDLQILIYLFIEPLNLKFSIGDMAESVLCFSILNRRSLFKRICHNYAGTDDLSKIFKPLYVSRFYLPFAVIICTFNIISIPPGNIKLDTLSEQFGNISNIPTEHLNYFAFLIHEMWLYRKYVHSM